MSYQSAREKLMKVYHLPMFFLLIGTSVTVTPMHAQTELNGIQDAIEGDKIHTGTAEEFVPGHYPVIKSGLIGDDPNVYSQLSSIAFAGSVTPKITGNLRAEFFHVEGLIRTRMMAVEVPMQADGQFAMTVTPHETGWPLNSMVVRLSISQVPQVWEESWIWITNDPVPKDFQPPFPFERANPVEYTRILLTPKEPHQADVFVIAQTPLSFCGRFVSKTDLAESTHPIVVKITRGRSIVASAGILAIKDGDEWWFEWLGSNAGLQTGEYAVSVNFPARSATPIVDGFKFKVVEDSE